MEGGKGVGCLWGIRGQRKRKVDVGCERGGVLDGVSMTNGR